MAVVLVVAAMVPHPGQIVLDLVLAAVALQSVHFPIAHLVQQVVQADGMHAYPSFFLDDVAHFRPNSSDPFVAPALLDLAATAHIGRYIGGSLLASLPLEHERMKVLNQVERRQSADGCLREGALKGDSGYRSCSGDLGQPSDVGESHS